MSHAYALPAARVLEQPAEKTDRPATKSASSKSWVNIRPRVAPSAVLTTISFSRVDVRVSIRRATLPQTTINSRTANALIEWMPEPDPWSRRPLVPPHRRIERLIQAQIAGPP